MPVCAECDSYLNSRSGMPSMPQACLPNDLMFFYSDETIVREEVTVLEMICAGPCVTAMMCFTLEARHRGESPFDSVMHMARHRMGARGNATTFPMPWQEIMRALSEPLVLPRTGEELANVVSVILKTSDEGDPREMSRFIHQATVRRSVVVKLIADAKARGHYAYRDIDMDAVRRRAKDLPEGGCRRRCCVLRRTTAISIVFRCRRQRHRLRDAGL